MTDLSERITELANTWDPEREADAYATSAFLQGILAGTCMGPDIMLKVKHVYTPTDGHGNYEHYFTVETESGHFIKVHVEPLIEPA